MCIFTYRTVSFEMRKLIIEEKVVVDDDDDDGDDNDDDEEEDDGYEKGDDKERSEWEVGERNTSSDKYFNIYDD